MRMSTDFTSLTILVGATDEEKALRDPVLYIMDHCSCDDVSKILIIHSKDASQGCKHTIEQLEKQFPNKVSGIQQVRPHIGGAILDGFDAAESSHVLILPGDLAIDLEPIPNMIEIAKQFPNDIVKTSRWLNKNSFINYSAARKRLNKCAQIFLRGLFRTDLTDLTNPVQIIPLDLCNSIIWKESNFPILLELVLTPLRLDVSFHEIATSCYGRTEGKSKNTILQTSLYIHTALRIRFTKKNKLYKPFYK